MGLNPHISKTGHARKLILGSFEPARQGAIYNINVVAVAYREGGNSKRGEKMNFSEFFCFVKAKEKVILRPSHRT